MVPPSIWWTPRRTDVRVLILTTFDLDEYVYAKTRVGRLMTKLQARPGPGP